MLLEISETLFLKEKRDMTEFFVIAPIMCNYVLWVLKDAVLNGKKRLYFLARDGYSMYQVANEFCIRLNLPIECCYLYCSRYALRSAEYCLLYEKSLEYICLGGMNVTFAKIMDRAGLSESEAKLVGELTGYADKMTAVLSHKEVKTLAPILKNCSVFMDAMVSHSRDKYPNVSGYLRQEGMLNDVPYALVDSGWVGSMQKSFLHILRSMGYQGKLEGYYFGMYEYPKNVDRDSYHVWYFRPENMLRRKVYFNNNLFECIFSSPEGMTVGFEWGTYGYTPVLEKDINPNCEKVEKSTAYLIKYAEMLAERLNKQEENAVWSKNDFLPTATKLLKNFMGKPTRLEASNYGDYVFCDDVIGETTQKLATNLTYKEIKANRLINKFINIYLKKGKSVRESAWPEASVMLVDKAGRRELVHCALYKYVLYLRKKMK